MKNTTIAVGILLLLAVGIFFLFSSSGKETVSPSSGSAQNLEGVQKLVLSVKNSNYYPNQLTVKSGEPVSITLDSSVQGCLRGININDLGVQGYSRSPSQTIDFTPTQKGTFRFACPMGMGYGKITVE